MRFEQRGERGASVEPTRAGSRSLARGARRRPARTESASCGSRGGRPAGGRRAAEQRRSAASALSTQRLDRRAWHRSIRSRACFVARSVVGGTMPFRRIRITFWPYSFMLWLTTPISTCARGTWFCPAGTISASDASVCAAYTASQYACTALAASTSFALARHLLEVFLVRIGFALGARAVVEGRIDRVADEPGERARVLGRLEAVIGFRHLLGRFDEIPERAWRRCGPAHRQGLLRERRDRRRQHHHTRQHENPLHTVFPPGRPNRSQGKREGKGNQRSSGTTSWLVMPGSMRTVWRT